MWLVNSIVILAIVLVPLLCWLLTRGHPSSRALAPGLSTFSAIFLRIAVVLSLLAGLLPTSVAAWTSGTPIDINIPSLGLDSGGVHQWLIDQAVEYLIKYGRIKQGSWFAGEEFRDRVKWGAAYADNTGREDSVTCYGHTESWDLDGNHHFYHSAPITIRYHSGPDEFPLKEVFIDIGIYDCSPLVHVGGLPAPTYAEQLYQRAVEFWPGGSTPLDLTTLTTPTYLGFLGPEGSNRYFYGWAQGTDPRAVWETPSQQTAFNLATNQMCGVYVNCVGLCDEPTDVVAIPWCVAAPSPVWPPWVLTPTEDKQTAAIYLGWALHMVQDSAVWHHATNIHGTTHQGYEHVTHDLIDQGGLPSVPFASNQAPYGQPEKFTSWRLALDANGNLYFQQYEVTRTPGQPVELCKPTYICPGFDCSDPAPDVRCYLHDPAPDYAFADPKTISPANLATSVAVYTTSTYRAYVDKYGSDSGDPGIPDMVQVYDYMAYPLDAAIKATAALIYKFIDDVGRVALTPDRFEPNNYYNQAAALGDGRHANLTLHSLQDEDYYLIDMPHQGDLAIKIEYDRQSTILGAELSGPDGLFSYVPRVFDGGEIFDLKLVRAGKYLLHLQPITTASYDLTIHYSDKSLPPDEFEENDTPAMAKEFWHGCYSPYGLTIDKAGDDDYYRFVPEPGWNISASIEFDPDEGELGLLLEPDQLSGSMGEAFAPPDQRTRTLAVVGCSNPALIRVTGDANWYSFCIDTVPDPVCGYVPPPGLGATTFTVQTDELIENVHILAFPKPTSANFSIAGMGNLFLPPDSDQDGGGDLATTTLALTPEWSFGSQVYYVVVGTTEDKSKLVVSASSGAPSAFSQGFAQFDDLLADISDGALQKSWINPCWENWEIALFLGWDCRSVFTTVGEGALLTPFGGSATLYILPEGRPIGSVTASTFGNP